jgi:hypothetical protein
MKEPADTATGGWTYWGDARTCRMPVTDPISKTRHGLPQTLALRRSDSSASWANEIPGGPGVTTSGLTSCYTA